MMSEKPRKQKRKQKAKVEFDAGKVFNVEASEDIQLDIEAAQYKARQGQGGDRRRK